MRQVSQKTKNIHFATDLLTCTIKNTAHAVSPSGSLLVFITSHQRTSAQL